jgi:hypothetical protein
VVKVNKYEKGILREPQGRINELLLKKVVWLADRVKKLEDKNGTNTITK